MNFCHDNREPVWQVRVVLASGVDDATALPGNRSGSNVRTAHVLVVGRDAPMLELIAHILRRASIEAIVTSSVPLALHSLDARAPGVIVVDSYGMHTTSTFTDGMGAPVIVLTADPPVRQPPDHVEYLRKPFAGSELVLRVRVHLDRLRAGLAIASAER